MSKREFYSRYIENQGYAVIRSIPSKDTEYVIFYSLSLEHAEQQAEVRNIWSSHQKYLKSFYSIN